MEILDAVEQLRLSGFEPLGSGKRLALGTMPIATAIETDALMAAGIALFHVATEGSGATQFDGAHGTPLPAVE